VSDETARNLAAVHAFFDAMNAGDVAGIVDAYAEDGTCTTMGRTLISGTFDKPTVAMAAGRIFEAFPQGIAFTVHSMTAQDDRVAVEASSRGMHVSGREYRNQYHFLARLRGGKLTEWKEYCDTEAITEVLCGGQRP
jgi:ketosteroid isomerase-like protein